ncbi:hypothetical protein MHBO_000263 [Bonamia ostreae]|uniref:Uncharacterized protein n=1 Tax=Bonamia ostreae TaxID=126728 RepID=A0ABV2AF14_9EUKA
METSRRKADWAQQCETLPINHYRYSNIICLNTILVINPFNGFNTIADWFDFFFRPILNDISRDIEIDKGGVVDWCGFIRSRCLQILKSVKENWWQKPNC